MCPRHLYSHCTCNSSPSVCKLRVPCHIKVAVTMAKKQGTFPALPSSFAFEVKHSFSDTAGTTIKVRATTSVAAATAAAPAAAGAARKCPKSDVDKKLQEFACIECNLPQVKSSTTSLTDFQYNLSPLPPGKRPRGNNMSDYWHSNGGGKGSKMQGSMWRRCAHPGCGFMVHTIPDVCDCFCCKACMKGYFDSFSKGRADKHGRLCEQVRAREGKGSGRQDTNDDSSQTPWPYSDVPCAWPPRLPETSNASSSRPSKGRSRSPYESRSR